MAVIGDISIFQEFEPIVKLVCHTTSCKHNLTQAANDPERTMLACNLKQITIDIDGSCRNYEKGKD